MIVHPKDTLGIIVNTNRYFDFVSPLVEAAADHNKSVHIHLVGSGCQFAVTDACMRLSQKAWITMCAKSARQMVPGIEEGIKGRISLVPPEDLTKLLKQCDRHVVF